MNIKVTKKYIKVPVSTYAVTKKLCLYRYENGEKVLIMDFNCKLDFLNPTYTAYMDVSAYIGEELEYCSYPEIAFSLETTDKKPADSRDCDEFRPFVHFTPMLGWINDPNGLIRYNGVYHMFFQHNPYGIEWGNMHWGHATSNDLLHWEEQDIALFPDKLGDMYSGSAIEDTKNLTGFGENGVSPLLLYYTAAGDRNNLAKGKSRTQCIAYSNDNGKTFIKYTGNPIIDSIECYNRDPKVVYVPELGKYVLILYFSDDKYGLFRSDNLLKWELFQEIRLNSESECPDIMSFTVNRKRYWVIIGASGKYVIGVFECGGFIQKTVEKNLNYSESSYAGQSFSGLDGGRVVRIEWDKIKMPSLKAPNQMSVPTEMKLLQQSNGWYLSSLPIAEIATLYCETDELNDIIDENETKIALRRAAYDISIECGFGGGFSIRVFGQNIKVCPEENSIIWQKVKIPLSHDLSVVKIRIIVDRCSLELFVDDGRFCATLPLICDYNLPYIAIIPDDKLNIRRFCCNRLSPTWANGANSENR